MRTFLFFLLCLPSATCFSQQFWEFEFSSKEEQRYKDVLKKHKVYKIYSFYHLKKGSPAIPRNVYTLDKNGNVLTVTKKADQEIPEDRMIEKNIYDAKGNKTAHMEMSGTDTLKAVFSRYDSLNHTEMETKTEADYKQGKDGKLERFYKTTTYTYENSYDEKNRLTGVSMLYNGRLILKTHLSYDDKGNITEIKRVLPNSCPDSWSKFTYDANGALKDKLYPNYDCEMKSTMNNNRYVYMYDAKKQLSGIEHTNSGEPRGKILYRYNAAGLLIYTEPDDEFGYYDDSFKYEFYKD